MKKFLTLALLCIVAIASYAATTSFINGVMYTINDDGTAAVYSFNAYATDFTEEIVIPETFNYDGKDYTVTSVENSGLQGISQVTRLTVTTVSLPSTIESIGNAALSTCTTVTTIYCHAATPPTLGANNNSFGGLSATVYVPEGSISAYEEAWTTATTGATSLTFAALDDDTSGSGSYTVVFSPENGGTATLPEDGFKEFTIYCADGIKEGTTSRTWRIHGNNDVEVNVSVNGLAQSDDGKTLTATLASTITTAGTYSLQYSSRTWTEGIPEGSFLVGPDGVDCGVTSYTFTFVEDEGNQGGSGPVMVVTPADGEEVKGSLSDIVVSCEDGIEFNVSGDVGMYFQVIDANNQVAAGVWKAFAVEDADGVVRSYTLPLYDDAITASDVPLTLTTAGEYTFTIPKEAFYLGTDKALSEEMTITFTLVEDEDGTGSASGLPYILDPENESRVPTLESFDLLWNDNGEYNKNNNGIGWNDMSANGWSGDVYDDNGVVVTTLYMDSYLYPEGESFMTGAEPYGLRFAYYNPINDLGTYTVTIPSGMVRFGETSKGSLGNYTEDIVVKYTVVGTGYSVSPASGADVTSLTVVTITPDEGEIVLSSEEDLSVTNIEGTEVTTASVAVESNVLVITLADAIVDPSQAGEYHILVPAGTFTCNGVPNDARDLVYYVNPDVDYTLDPADGETKESISTVTVGYHDGVCVASGVAMSSITITGDDGTVYPMASYDTLEETYDGDSDATIYAVVLNLETAITAEGTYTLNIPRNSLQFYVGISADDDEGISGGEVEDGWIYSNLITATYVVEGGAGEAKTFDYSFDPAAGEVTSLHSITISCEDGIQLNAKESQWGNAKVYDADGNEVVEVIYASPIAGEGYYADATYSGYSFTLGKDLSSQDVTAPGEYDFVLPAEYISFYDVETGQYVLTTEAITVHYTIPEGGITHDPDDLTYEVDPADGAEVLTLTQVTFLRDAGLANFVGGITGFADDGSDEDGVLSLSSLYVADEDGNVVSRVGGISEGYDDNWQSFSVSITYYLDTDVVDEGTYYFHVPAGAFGMFDNGEFVYCEDITLTYYVLGGGVAAGLVFDPESGTTHESLSGFTVTYSGEGGMSATTMPNDGASVYLEGNDEEYTYADYEEVYDDDSGLCVAVVFTFAQELTEAGTYNVVIPAELLYYGYGGVNSEDIVLVYIISHDEDAGEETGISGIGINGENVEGIYSTSGLKLNATQKGVNIVRLNDGTTKKILVK